MLVCVELIKLLADEGLKVLKRAEDAVKEATPYLLTPLEI
jgi:hypothetical protein